jgi:hypothetical protein
LSKNVKIGIYQTILLPVVSYGCKAWSTILREEHRLRVFENRVLRRIFGPKRDEMVDGSKKLHNEGLHNFYFSPSIMRMIKSKGMRWAGHVAAIGEKRTLMGKPQGKRPLGRPRYTWENNIATFLWLCGCRRGFRLLYLLTTYSSYQYRQV